MDVAASAVPTLGRDEGLTSLCQVAQDGAIAVFDDHPGGNLDDEIFAPSSVAIPTLPGLASLGSIFPSVGQIKQGAALRICDQDHRAAVSAITTCRTAAWSTWLAKKRRTAVAAVATTDKDRAFVDKLHQLEPRRAHAARYTEATRASRNTEDGLVGGRRAVGSHRQN